MPHITLLNLHWLEFGGASAYLDGLLSRITTPLLSKLHTRFFDQLLPYLLQFMSASQNLKYIGVLFDLIVMALFRWITTCGDGGLALSPY